MATILKFFIRINWLNLTKIAPLVPLVQWIPCALVQKLSVEKAGDKTQGVASTWKPGGTCGSMPMTSAVDHCMLTYSAGWVVAWLINYCLSVWLAAWVVAWLINYCLSVWLAVWTAVVRRWMESWVAVTCQACLTTATQCPGHSANQQVNELWLLTCFSWFSLILWWT